MGKPGLASLAAQPPALTVPSVEEGPQRSCIRELLGHFILIVQLYGSDSLQQNSKSKYSSCWSLSLREVMHHGGSTLI